MKEICIATMFLILCMTFANNVAASENEISKSDKKEQDVEDFITRLPAQIDSLAANIIESRVLLNGVLQFQSELAKRVTAIEITNSVLGTKMDTILSSVNTASSSINGLSQEAHVITTQISNINEGTQIVRENIAKLNTKQDNVDEKQKDNFLQITAKLNEIERAQKDIPRMEASTKVTNSDVRFYNSDENALKLLATCGSTKKESRPADCYDLLKRGKNESGIYEIYPRSLGGTKHIEVFCDMVTSGGGWTVIQRRDSSFNPRVDFYRGWAEYKYGFGLLDQEFWLGLENMRALTSSRDYKLRFDLSDFEDGIRYAEYSFLSLADESSLYKMDLGDYEGDAGDSFTPQKGMKFSTKDQDNDLSVNEHCSERYHSGWWHNKCHSSNINGRPLEGNHTSQADGIDWKDWHGYHYSLKTTEMKLRPVYI